MPRDDVAEQLSPAWDEEDKFQSLKLEVESSLYQGDGYPSYIYLYNNSLTPGEMLLTQ